MKKAELQEQWNYLKLILGNVRQQVALIPESKLGFKPTPDVRSLSELAVHMHMFLTDSTSSVLSGAHVQGAEPAFVKKADLLTWIDQQVDTAYTNFGKITDAQIAAKIVAWGETFACDKMLSFVFDEVVHHRGQLTVYLRLIGIPPIFIYKFEP